MSSVLNENPPLIVPFQHYSDGKLWVIDQQPDRENTIKQGDRNVIWLGEADPDPSPNGRRYRPGIDPPMHQRLLMDYDTGCEACIRNPQRYRAAGMSDADYATLVAFAANRVADMR